MIIFDTETFNSGLDDYLMIDVKHDINNNCLIINTFEHDAVMYPEYAKSNDYPVPAERYYYDDTNYKHPDWFHQIVGYIPGWNIEALNGQVSSVAVENVQKHSGSIELYAGDNARNGFLCKFEYAEDQDFNRNDLAKNYCKNNKARSMKICNAKQGTIITIFDDSDFARDEAFLTIHVLSDLLNSCVTIFNFENNRRIDPPEYVETEYQPGPWHDNGLNGKISSITVKLGETQ